MFQALSSRKLPFTYGRFCNKLQFQFAGCTNLQECPKLTAAAADNLKLSEMSGRKERGQQEKLLNPNLLDLRQIQNPHQT